MVTHRQSALHSVERLGPLDAIAALGLLGGPAHAQRAGGTAYDALGVVGCSGERVSGIDVRALPPPARGGERVWRAVAHAVGFPYGTTKPHIVLGLLQLRVGEPCTELHRAESERVLRAQPFLASAEVRAMPDGAGQVRIAVRTVDEVPALVRLRVRGVNPQALTIANENVDGRAVSVALSAERGGAYRDGFGVRVEDHAVVRAPFTAVVEARRRPLGSTWSAELARPFYTDLQPTAWHVGAIGDDAYRRLVRPGGDPLALRVRQMRWEVGGMYRRPLRGNAAFLGAVLTGVRDTPDAVGVLVSDAGLVVDADSVLRGRYAPFEVVRPGVLIGARMVHFVAARGFETLGAVEDLVSGVQVGGLAGRGIEAWGANDVYLAGTVYAGHAGPTALAAFQLEIEGRRDFDVGGWNGLIASGRMAWYRKHGERWLLRVSDEFSGGTRARLPLQLTLGERQGGLRGYHGSTLAGAWRNVARIEERWVRGTPVRNVDLGLAGFAEAGSLWAGSAPYGRSVPFRGSVGASVLAAYPAGSRRLVRLDVTAPSGRDGNRALEVRVSAEQMIGRFWREPAEVTRARTGPVPSTLFTWRVR
jgi:hypothetical protein